MASFHVYLPAAAIERYIHNFRALSLLADGKSARTRMGRVPLQSVLSGGDRGRAHFGTYNGIRDEQLYKYVAVFGVRALLSEFSAVFILFHSDKDQMARVARRDTARGRIHPQRMGRARGDTVLAFKRAFVLLSRSYRGMQTTVYESAVQMGPLAKNVIMEGSK